MTHVLLPNPRASLDAAVAFCLHFEAHTRRASEPERSAVSILQDEHD